MNASELQLESADVATLLCNSPSIIMLDGLDEVADLSARERVVNAIECFSSNLQAWKADCQLIVTSRPSTVPRQQRLGSGDFARLVLTDLPKELINKYSERWLHVRALDSEQAEEFRQVLSVALASPHVADLARNPMQLAILLHLVHLRGWSMPEKRTALYDAYLDTFLTREAEKSPLVRQNRDLLLELHGYIGWVLHARAEDAASHGGTVGDIERGELISLVERYLRNEERSTDLASSIFAGVQRFFVLVEREEGRFEFEVQPLREFFAARYLYMTSPQGPSSMAVSGSRPERLDALLRSPYWANVTRFFCGYFTKGELPGLARQLEDLIASPNFGRLLFSYGVIERILRDYSLSASQRDTNAVVKSYCQGPGLRMLANRVEAMRSGTAESAPLDEETGKSVVVREIRERLLLRLPDELVREYTRVAREHDENCVDWWWSVLQSVASTNNAEAETSRYNWLRRGVQLRAIQQLDQERALRLFDPDSVLDDYDWYRLVEAGRGDVAAYDSVRLARVSAALSNGPATVGAVPDPYAGWLGLLAYKLCSDRWFILRHGGHNPWMEPIDYLESIDIPSSSELVPLVGLAGQLTTPDALSDRSIADWWMESVAATVSVLGEGWAAWRIALTGVTLRTLPEGSGSGIKVWDRARRAYTSRDDVGYWREALADDFLLEGGAVGERLGIVAAFLAWASGAVIEEILPELVPCYSKLQYLELAEIREFYLDLVAVPKTLKQSERKVSFRKLKRRDVPASLLLLIAPRMSAADRRELTSHVRGLPVSAQERAIVDAELLEEDVFRVLRDPSNALLDAIEERYLTARYGETLLGRTMQGRLVPQRAYERFPSELVNMILSKPAAFPWTLVVAANDIGTVREFARIRPMRATSSSGQWFEEEGAYES
jgi:hypothetical protein